MIQLYPLPRFLSKSPKDDPIHALWKKAEQHATARATNCVMALLLPEPALRTSMPEGTRGSPARHSASAIGTLRPNIRKLGSKHCATGGRAWRNPSARVWRQPAYSAVGLCMRHSDAIAGPRDERLRRRGLRHKLSGGPASALRGRENGA